jgi:hypothetical protein
MESPITREEESGDLVAYQIGIEIEHGLRVFVGRRGEPGRDTLQQQRQAPYRGGD